MVFKSEVLIRSDNVIGDVILFDFVTGLRVGMYVFVGIMFIIIGLFGDMKYGLESRVFFFIVIFGYKYVYGEGSINVDIVRGY